MWKGRAILPKMTLFVRRDKYHATAFVKTKAQCHWKAKNYELRGKIESTQIFLIK